MSNNGVPWIGKSPAHWKPMRMSQLAIPVKCKNTGMIETNLLSLSYGKIVRKDIERAEGLAPASYEEYNIISEGDIVLRLTDLQNDQRSLRTGLAGERGIITSAYLTIRPNVTHVFPAYLHYLLYAIDVAKIFYNMGSGLRQSLDWSGVSHMLLPVPSVETQRYIADYLDERCGAIDEARKAIENEIEALRRLRKTAIFKAVTKGLDDKVSMRDSRIEWIGDAPATWEFPRFKTVYRQVKRAGNPKEELLSVYLNYGVIRFSDDDSVRVHKTSSDTSGYQLVLPGDLVMNNQQAWRGSVGVSTLRGIISPAYHVFHAIDPSAMDNRYANYMFRSCMVPAYELCSHGVGSIQRNISPEEFGYEHIPLPSFEEQRRIADYLDNRCAAIDSIIDMRTNQLERLEDYRKSLIYSYASGKKEVSAS